MKQVGDGGASPTARRPERVRSVAGLAALYLAGVVAGCGPSAPTMSCFSWADSAGLAARPSPFDSVMLKVDTVVAAKLCYSRPYARGRAIFGGLVPYDTLWRTGANEPTILHVDRATDVAGLRVGPGEYSIYTVPSSGQWMVVVNRSTRQWGLTRDERDGQGNVLPNAYTDEVRGQELGRAEIETEQIPFVEQLTATFEAAGGPTYRLLLDWETTRIVVPLRFEGESP